MVTQTQNYSLLGYDGQAAIQSGLASAKWYRSDISRKTIKALSQRRDGPALRGTAIWLGSMIACAGIAIVLYPHWWSLPFFIIYGVMYGSGSDSRWHECGHGTAFKTRWMNQVVYHIACFMIMRNPVTWRWSHARHHTDTIVVGRDPEIVAMRPPDLRRISLNFFGIIDTFHAMKTLLQNASGHIDGEAKSYVPENQQPHLITVARFWLAIYLFTIISAVWLGSLLPLLLIGLPRLYGAWHHVLTGVLQHSGLAENVIDHRLNTRTVYLNRFSRFVYWNMNYHVEHHMFPMVPYHALPELHELIKHDLPAPNTSIVQAYREVIPALKRQLSQPDHYIQRSLPSTARPYLYRDTETDKNQTGK